MESIHTVLNLVTPKCWMASLDFKDGYYSVKIHPDFKKMFQVLLQWHPLQVHSPPQWSMHLPKKVYKDDETTFSIFETMWSYHIWVY